MPDALREEAASIGVAINDRQTHLLMSYGEWLDREAVKAGGLGPGESLRIPARHLLDSLAFSLAWSPSGSPETALDLGSGVGLPGIPLAILWPRTQMTLIDRSGGRARLARRAIRVLGIDNTEVVEADIDHWKARAAMVSARAVSRPERLLALLRRLVLPEGVGVVGGSRRGSRPVAGYRLLEVGSVMLDPPVRLLIMRAP
jgi:16S rRNA (guanine527-N7)-methyltransferase